MVKKAKFMHPRLLPSERTVSPGKGPAFGSEYTSGSHTANGAAHPLPV